VLSKAVDLTKDQSYVLWGLPQEVISRTIFPLGGFLKTEVRKMAADRGYDELSKKAESFEICFVPDNDYRGFLKRNVEGLEAQVEGGNYELTDGTIVGKHRGYPFYTIGQRKGLDLALGRPIFVVKIIPETNTVVLGEAHELEGVDLRVKGINWVKWPGVLDGQEAVTKIRYKDAGAEGFLQRETDDSVLVHFHHAVSGIAPGQSAVFYDGDDVIGGGIIHAL
jgi:tRNA-specific 2-thiouridylase